MIYVVTNRVTGAEVYRYAAEAPVEWAGLGFDTHAHEPLVEPSVSAGSPPAVTRLTKLAFIDRLGEVAYRSILALARVDLDVEAFVKRFEMTTPDADGTSVDLTDPRTVAGVTLIGAALHAEGRVSATWAQEVLNGN